MKAHEMAGFTSTPMVWYSLIANDLTCTLGCVSIHAGKHAHTVHTYIHTYIHTPTPTHQHMHTHTHTHTHTPVPIRVSVRTHLHFLHLLLRFQFCTYIRKSALAFHGSFFVLFNSPGEHNVYDSQCHFPLPPLLSSLLLGIHFHSASSTV